MKKLLIILIIITSFINVGLIYAGTSNCGTDTDTDISSMLNDCQPDNVLGSENKTTTSINKWINITTARGGGYDVKDGLKAKILFIATNLVVLASILAIGGLVYSGVMFTTAYGDDGKIKKAKDAIKWSLIGFLIALASQQLINAIINLVYGISNN